MTDNKSPITGELIDTKTNVDELEHLHVQDTKYVLSLDGGGIKGAYTARILDKISELIGVPVQSKFDLIVGTSIGGILALGIAQVPKTTLIKVQDWFERDNINTIFDKSLLDKTLGMFQWKPIYDGKGKRCIINKYLHDMSMHDVVTPVAITSFVLGNFHPHIFKSWESYDNIRDVADITSSAPIYFPPIRYKNAWFIDGGIGVNNPGFLAAVYAKELYPNSHIKLLSIGTGSWFPDLNNCNVDSWGIVEWVKHGIFDMLMSGASRVNDIACELIFEKDFLRINHKENVDISLDDTHPDTLTALYRYADETFEQKKDSIIKFFA